MWCPCVEPYVCPSGDEEWKKEPVNGSQSHMLKGLKEGLDYKVRVVAKGHSDQMLHHSEEILIKVPGEAGSQPGLLRPSFMENVHL